MRITLLLIATRNYKQFVAPLLEGVQKHFFPNDEVNVIIFTDEVSYLENFQKPENRGRLNIGLVHIRSYGYPEATLYRYKMFASLSEDLLGDYIFYCDTDMKFVGDVGRDILGDIVAVRHPGFFKGGWGDYGTKPESNAYLEPKERFVYFAGGFQGGEKHAYLNICEILANRIESDETKGIRAEHNDESHWNWYLNHDLETLTIQDPSYCMVQEQSRRILWGINHLEPKIIALTKNHAEIRA